MKLDNVVAELEKIESRLKDLVLDTDEDADNMPDLREILSMVSRLIVALGG